MAKEKDSIKRRNREREREREREVAMWDHLKQLNTKKDSHWDFATAFKILTFRFLCFIFVFNFYMGPCLLTNQRHGFSFCFAAF